MNGNAFDSLINLKSVTLVGNECIDESFENQTRILMVSQIVSESCGFTENRSSTIDCGEEIKNIEIPLNDKIAKLETKITANAKLEVEIGAAKVGKAKAEDQVEKCEKRSEAMRISVDTGVKKIQELSAELQEKTVEIENLNNKIVKLKRKIDLLLN